MKSICIVRDDSPFWWEIAGYLKTANARVFLLDEENAAEELADKRADIIIACERSLKTLPPASKDIPKIVIVTGDVPQAKSKGIYFLKWPENRASLLDVTSRLLHISERRLFRAVIGVAKQGDPGITMGRSEDFSLSGIAFKIDRALKKGDVVTISFFVPGSDKRLSLDAEVARSSVDPADGAVYYGARFVNLSPQVQDTLRKFVSKGAAPLTM